MLEIINLPRTEKLTILASSLLENPIFFSFKAENALTVQRIRDATTLETERIMKEAETKGVNIKCVTECGMKEVVAEADLKCGMMQAKGDKGECILFAFCNI